MIKFFSNSLNYSVFNKIANTTFITIVRQGNETFQNLINSNHYQGAFRRERPSLSDSRVSQRSHQPTLATSQHSLTHSLVWRLRENLIEHTKSVIRRFYRVSRDNDEICVLNGVVSRAKVYYVSQHDTDSFRLSYDVTPRVK